MYICAAGNLQIMAHFVNNCYISTLKLLGSLFGCRRLWPGWKRIETWKIEAKLFKLFPNVFKKIDINGRGLFSLCELRSYLPLDANFRIVWAKVRWSPHDLAPLSECASFNYHRLSYTIWSGFLNWEHLSYLSHKMQNWFRTLTWFHKAQKNRVRVVAFRGKNLAVVSASIALSHIPDQKRKIHFGWKFLFKISIVQHVVSIIVNVCSVEGPGEDCIPVWSVLPYACQESVFALVFRHLIDRRVNFRRQKRKIFYERTT